MTRRPCTYDRGLCQFMSYNSHHLVSLAQPTKASMHHDTLPRRNEEASMLYRSRGLKIFVDNEEYKRGSPQACMRTVLL